MPYRYEDATTPKGAPYLRVTATGHISFRDVDEFNGRLKPGQRYHGGLVLTRLEKGAEFSIEARKHMANMDGNFRRIAAVVTSPLVRAAVNMMVRIFGTTHNFVMFSSEAAALAWLDEAA